MQDVVSTNLESSSTESTTDIVTGTQNRIDNQYIDKNLVLLLMTNPQENSSPIADETTENIVDVEREEERIVTQKRLSGRPKGSITKAKGFKFMGSAKRRTRF